VEPSKIVAIVDDDATVLSALSSLIRSLGVGALTCLTGEGLLADPHLSSVAFLISDIQINGGMNGFELLAALQALHIRIPSVLITGAPTPEREAQARIGGALALLPKPVDSDRLCQLLEEAVAHGDPR
jgi:FixJ family two-component response regulator